MQYLTVPSLFLTKTVGEAHSDAPGEMIFASKSLSKCSFSSFSNASGVLRGL